MQTFWEFLETYSNTGWDDLHPNVFGTTHSNELPVPTLEIPAKVIRDRIQEIKYNKTPITIYFDNSNAVLTLTKKQWNYYISQGKKPEVGQNVVVEFYDDLRIKSFEIVGTQTPPAKKIQKKKIKSYDYDAVI